MRKNRMVFTVCFVGYIVSSLLNIGYWCDSKDGCECAKYKMNEDTSEVSESILNGRYSNHGLSGQLMNDLMGKGHGSLTNYRTPIKFYSSCVNHGQYFYEDGQEVEGNKRLCPHAYFNLTFFNSLGNDGVVTNRTVYESLRNIGSMIKNTQDVVMEMKLKQFIINKCQVDVSIWLSVLIELYDNSVFLKCWFGVPKRTFLSINFDNMNYIDMEYVHEKRKKRLPNIYEYMSLFLEHPHYGELQEKYPSHTLQLISRKTTTGRRTVEELLYKPILKLMKRGKVAVEFFCHFKNPFPFHIYFFNNVLTHCNFSKWDKSIRLSIMRSHMPFPKDSTIKLCNKKTSVIYDILDDRRCRETPYFCSFRPLLKIFQRVFCGGNTQEGVEEEYNEKTMQEVYNKNIQSSMNMNITISKDIVEISLGESSMPLQLILENSNFHYLKSEENSLTIHISKSLLRPWSTYPYNNIYNTELHFLEAIKLSENIKSNSTPFSSANVAIVNCKVADIMMLLKTNPSFVLKNIEKFESSYLNSSFKRYFDELSRRYNTPKDIGKVSPTSISCANSAMFFDVLNQITYGCDLSICKSWESLVSKFQDSDRFWCFSVIRYLEKHTHPVLTKKLVNSKYFDVLLAKGQDSKGGTSSPAKDTHCFLEALTRKTFYQFTPEIIGSIFMYKNQNKGVVIQHIHSHTLLHYFCKEGFSPFPITMFSTMVQRYYNLIKDVKKVYLRSNVKKVYPFHEINSFRFNEYILFNEFKINASVEKQFNRLKAMFDFIGVSITHIDMFDPIVQVNILPSLKKDVILDSLLFRQEKNSTRVGVISYDKDSEYCGFDNAFRQYYRLYEGKILKHLYFRDFDYDYGNLHIDDPNIPNLHPFIVEYLINEEIDHFTCNHMNICVPKRISFRGKTQAMVSKFKYYHHLEFRHAISELLSYTYSKENTSSQSSECIGDISLYDDVAPFHASMQSNLDSKEEAVLILKAYRYTLCHSWIDIAFTSFMYSNIMEGLFLKDDMSVVDYVLERCREQQLDTMSNNQRKMSSMFADTRHDKKYLLDKLPISYWSITFTEGSRPQIRAITFKFYEVLLTRHADLLSPSLYQIVLSSNLPDVYADLFSWIWYSSDLQHILYYEPERSPVYYQNIFDLHKRGECRKDEEGYANDLFPNVTSINAGVEKTVYQEEKQFTFSFMRRSKMDNSNSLVVRLLKREGNSCEKERRCYHSGSVRHLMSVFLSHLCMTKDRNKCPGDSCRYPYLVNSLVPRTCSRPKVYWIRP